MPMHHMLLMQRIPYQYFSNMVKDHAFQPVKAVLKDVSDTTAILLVFVSVNQLTSIVHVHIRLVVHHISSQINEPKAIPQFIQYIKADLKHTKEKQEASSSTLREQSYCMFVANFGGIMALPTDPPYCLEYLNIYSSTIPEKDRHHFNIGGSPPGVCTHMCICCTLLQHADMSTDHRQQHHGSHLVIARGAQYDHLLPKIMMPCNHQVLLVDLSMGEPFPLVPVGGFQLEDNILPGTTGDSLLYTSEELTKLQKMRFQVAMHCPAHEDETSQLSCSSGEAPSSTHKNGDPPKATGSLGRKSSHHKHSPPSKECHRSHDRLTQFLIQTPE